MPPKKSVKKEKKVTILTPEEKEEQKNMILEKLNEAHKELHELPGKKAQLNNELTIVKSHNLKAVIELIEDELEALEEEEEELKEGIQQLEKVRDSL